MSSHVDLDGSTRPTWRVAPNQWHISAYINVGMLAP